MELRSPLISARGGHPSNYLENRHWACSERLKFREFVKDLRNMRLA